MPENVSKDANAGPGYELQVTTKYAFKICWIKIYKYLSVNVKRKLSTFWPDKTYV